MAEKTGNRDVLARLIVILSVLILGIICILAIFGVPVDDRGDTAKDILTMVLPVIATWIGTVIAFYFGRENFEAANAQVSKLVMQMPGVAAVTNTIASIMRTLAKTKHVKDSNAGKLTIDAINQNFGGAVSRLLVVNDDNHPTYIIHQSRLDNFIKEGGNVSDTLAAFIADRKTKKSINFGDGAGFVTVAKDATIDEAKRDMEAINGCQDIIITDKGGAKEPVLGWVSNTRLSRSRS